MSEPGQPPPPPSRRRLRRTGPSKQEARRRLAAFPRFHPSRGQFVAAALTAALGIGLVAQARSVDDAGLGQLRETELVALLDDVTTRADSLAEEVRQLEADRARLQGEDGDAAAALAARQRLDTYSILAGTVPVQGPGITLQVDDPGSVITQTMLLDGIQELRDAGAEAIQIGTVRVVASSFVGTDSSGQVLLDGVPVQQPYRIVAVGDSHTLAGAMAIPGGFTDSLRGAGASVSVVETETVQIEALHEPREARYAQPVPSGQAP
jgi:uncharacterized protein YlxW (UPF0749 family)